MFKTILTISLLASTALTMPVLAEDRALLIGVGEYQNPQHNLPGIDLDINMMKKAADLMGFNNIKTLLNEQATLNNVTKTMEDYLINGVNSNDRVLIYFSGHGTNIPDENGDEADEVDEVLTMHDLQLATIAGKRSLKGVLIDDTLNAILKKIPSRNTLLLIDACHSGTATKDIKFTGSTPDENNEIKSKSFQYEGMPMISKGNFMVQAKSQSDHYVAISAAADTEVAQATRNGSLFTLGILAAVKQAAIDMSPLTANTLKASVTQYIEKKNTKKPFTPQLSGNDQLANKVIKMRSTKTAYGKTWSKLTKFVENSDPLSIKINQTKYSKGDFLKITIDNNQSGYLSVINVGPKDQPTVLFPNKYNPDSKVSGSITIPTPQMSFDLPVQEPYGKSLIVAFLTNKPLDLYKTGKGDIDDVFHSLSAIGEESLTRSFGVQAKTSSKLKAGKVITLVCESAADCN